jgi:FMN phosphatase YigB (HAD superfamily)
MKKHIFLLLSLFFAGTISAQIFYRQGLSLSDVYKKKEATLAWDLNEVIFNANYSVLIKHPIMALKMGKMNKKKKEFKKQGRDEGYIFEATIRYCKPKKAMKYIDFMAKLMEPNYDVVGLMHKLKEKGHTHAILSNMGETIWANLCPKHSVVGRLFTGHNCIAHKKSNGRWYHKPDADYFQLFVNLNKTSDDTIIVFIDDDKYGCHIPSALKNGIDVAIKFNNPRQLELDLAVLGLI